jgi:UDP-N-acetylmuramoyl-L-alanyl-D-glutamate--2,6-diaminopimelate ligase
MPSQGERLGRLASITGGTVVGDRQVRVIDATHDSRQVVAGGLFIAVVGASADGHDFCTIAEKAGATALMVSRPVAVDLPQLIVVNTRRAMAPVAAAIHGDPSRRLELVGVTGTNGKTTSTFLIEAIARSKGMVTGLIGTVMTRAADDLIPNPRTTPEATDFQRILAVMVERGVQVVAAEASSHALALGRIDSTWFEVAAFTNLSPDHLDFHGDMESYFAAKAALFDPARVATAVINVDDPYGARLAEQVAVPVVTVGTGADLSAAIIESTTRSLLIEMHFPDGSDRRLLLPLGGTFNLENALVAAGCTHALGYTPDEIVAGLEQAPQIPGRLETVSGDHPVTVIVDYAHTPAGIEAVLAAMRPHTGGRLLVVFGAGGDRDRSKRPAMGAAAAAADVLVLTSDNPRSEDPAAIISQVMSGIPQHVVPIVEPDRATAIDLAVSMAEPGDVVMILGKGHERGQETEGRIAAFDDRLVARAAIERRGRPT